MPVIDADSHVDETEATWEYMSKSEMHYKPITVFPDSIHPVHVRAGNGRLWRIDGHLQQRRVRENLETGEVLQPTGGTTVATRELLDIPARLRHMDELGIDVQVLYPTLFIDAVTTNPEEERAITNSYNRWLADRTSESAGRLRWIIVPSLLDLDNAAEQLRFGREHGACGVIMKGAGGIDGTAVVDPYFYPLYSEASRLGLPVCFHTGAAIPDFTISERLSSDTRAIASANRFYQGVLPVVHAFHALVMVKLPVHFPDQRWAFIEASSSWIPYLIYDLKRRQIKQAGRATQPQFEVLEDLVARNRLYVTCQADEDLASITASAGEDNLIVGTDYSHPDPSFDLQVMRNLRERGEKGEVPSAVIQKVLCENPRALYGL